MKLTFNTTCYEINLQYIWTEQLMYYHHTNTQTAGDKKEQLYQYLYKKSYKTAKLQICVGCTLKANFVHSPKDWIFFLKFKEIKQNSPGIYS